MSPFRFVPPLLILLMSLFASSSAVSSNDPVYIGVTPVFLNNQTTFLNDWKAYLSEKLQRPVVFKQRNTYREISNLLLTNQIDFAWTCGYPYLRHRQKLRLVAVPVYQGKPLYRAYLIVPASDIHTRSINDLRGQVFAFSDPDSNSGHLVPQYQLVTQGERSDKFFRKTFFTWSHENVVRAVANGVANGGSVDGYVWDTLEMLNPDLTAQTRVVKASQFFGFPPLVARKDIPSATYATVQNTFLTMNRDPRGLALLRRLNLDRFSEENESLYDGIAAMMDTLGSFLENDET